MKKTLVFTIFILSTIYIYAQVKFTASSEKIVEKGKTFQLDFTVNAQASGFRASGFPNFKIISGPNSSTSQSISMGNGRTTQSTTTTFSYYLQAKRTGKFTINPASVIVNGKRYKSNSLNIEVVKGAPPEKDKKSGISSNDLFIRVNLSKTSVYQGEHIIASIKVYTRVGLRSLDDVKFPSYTGFLSPDIDIPTRISLQRENVGGKVFEVGLLKQNILFPQKTGQLTIEPASVEVYVREKVGKGRDFFGRIVDRYENVKKILKSAKKTVTVKPLPGNRPDNFSGLVGQNFVMEANIDKNNIKTDEGTNIKIKISGNGNIKLLDDIKLDIPPAFEQYEPKITERISNTSSGSSGYKNIEYFLLAREPGEYKIAPVEFSYFDITSKKFITLKSEEFVINVEEGENYSERNSENNNNVSQNEIEIINKDIKFIKQKNSIFVRKGENFALTFKFYLFYVLSFLIFIVLIILFRKRIKENADITKVRTKKASKISRKRLKTAGTYLKNKKKTEFYKEILTAVWGYIGDKLSIEASNLQREKINDILIQKNIDQEIINSLIALLDTCEYAQYAPVGENEKPEHIYKKASEIINELEKKL